MNVNIFLMCLKSCVTIVSTLGTVYTVQAGVSLLSGVTEKSPVSYDLPTRGACSLKCFSTSECYSTIYSVAEEKCYIYIGDVDFNIETSLTSSVALITAKNSRELLTSYDDTYQDCHEAFELGRIRHNEVYTLKPSSSWNKTVRAICQFDDSSGWTVMQTRLDGSEDFNRGWDDYVDGFGNSSGEYWIGLDAIHWLTKADRTLSVYLEDHDGESRTANYTTFYVNGPESNYRLNISGYTGDAGDFFTGGPSSWSHHNMMFTTKDRDNDKKSTYNCAQRYKGGWWFNSCYYSNLNGIWYEGGNGSTDAASTETWRDAKYSYKTIYMRITR